MKPVFPKCAVRIGALAIALACAQGAIAGNAGDAAPDPATDPAGAWTHFLANGVFADAWKAYDVLPDLEYTYATVDAAACRTHADALQASLRKAPVGLALHRAAMLCAEAQDDDATAEREMQAIAGLGRYALRNAHDSENAGPIPVLRQQDAYVLVRALGLDPQYEWFEQTRATRTFPILIAAWDPERKTERVMRFDWIDVAQRISREAEAQFPFHRDEVAEAQIRANARTNDVASIDQLAWRDALQADAPQAKLEKLRMAVGAGGLQSAHIWLSYCSEPDAPKTCGDGFVDVILPLAETKHALPMVQLAYAYGEGIGVARDAAVMTQLLDAADRRWARGGASLRYATMWIAFHENKPLPAALVARVEGAAAKGNDDARVLLVQDRLRRDKNAPLSAAEIALLSSKVMNGAGEGDAFLATIAQERKQDADHARYEQLAADAGDAYRQGQVAWKLLYGDGKHDKAEGERLLVEAAHGGSAWAARQLSWRAADAGDALAAERWLIQPSRAGNIDAVLALAAIYESEMPGTTGDAKRAAEIYRNLSGMSAEARRRLSMLAARGKGMEKDVALARGLLQKDAEKGDHEAEGLLGLSLLNGDLGASDEAEGVRWIERAIAGGNQDVASDYGYFLYYRKGTVASRAQALDVWRKALSRGDTGIENNLAWALCTAPFADVRNPKEGLAIVSEMGAIVDLPVHVLDTVAACHAANGDFAEARHVQGEAIAQIDAALAKRAEAKAVAAKAPARSAAAKVGRATTVATIADEEDPGGYRARLKLYADGKPYLDDANRRE